jgi:hypothetical protein
VYKGVLLRQSKASTLATLFPSFSLSSEQQTKHDVLQVMAGVPFATRTFALQRLSGFAMSAITDHLRADV